MSLESIAEDSNESHSSATRKKGAVAAVDRSISEDVISEDVISGGMELSPADRWVRRYIFMGF